VGYLAKTAPVDKVLAILRQVGTESLAAGLDTPPDAGQSTERPPSAAPTRLLVAGGDPDVLDALVDLVAGDPSLELVGAAHDIAAAVRMATMHRPDVALVDAGKPGPPGVGPAIASELRRRLPSFRVAQVKISSDEVVIRHLLRSGSESFLIRRSSPVDVRLAVGRAVGSGEGSVPVPLGELVVCLHDAESLARRRANILRVIAGGHGMTMAYQPIFNLDTGDVLEVEALARFVMRPLRAAGVWFREADGAGLGEELELFAVRSGLPALESLSRPVGLAFNVSAGVAASPGLASLLDPDVRGRVALQIQETDAIDDYRAFTGAMDRLRADGVRLELDAVGSDLRPDHIRRLRPDQLNVDLDLCRLGAGDQARRDGLLRVLALADEVGARVVAGGIESGPQMEQLRGVDIIFGQGYYLGQPGPLPAR
jgi:EAL domain-containing protein (putative c-di-GMP-specific phosphodiesterase class I)